MKRGIVLFGTGKFASLVRYCLTHDSDDKVVGFTVDKCYLSAAEGVDLPVVDYAEVERTFPPDNYAMMFPIGPHQRNGIRRDRYKLARQRGYNIGSYVSSRAITWPDLSIGEGAIVFDGAIVQPFARIGANAVVRSGAHLSHHVTVGDHCFVAAGACLGGGAVVEDECTIGLNATVRDGVTIAQGCLIAAGAVVVADTEPNGLYMGVPAKPSRSGEGIPEVG
jgi:sugar O-acyltransferase (sialic acid O-acetyltransferase NeuD family)